MKPEKGSAQESLEDIFSLCFINWAETLERLEQKPPAELRRKGQRRADKAPPPPSPA